MDAIRRTSTLRRVATTASLAALLVIPGTADAKKAKPKSPVITSVTPMKATVGDTLTIKGRNFRKGKGKNSVGFKRDGQAVVFVKSGISTTRVMAVRIPARLEKVMESGPAKFHLRVLAKRFGKAYTGNSLSPTIAPKPAVAVPGETPTPTPNEPGPAQPALPCNVPDREDVDTDADMLSNALENRLGTGACDDDTDDDTILDGYEYRSAIDLNDDEYQQPNQTLFHPGELGYPNPLAKDADVDYDNDSLPLQTEHDLWAKLTPKDQRTVADQGDAATPLSYSDGLRYSVSRRCGTNETGGLCGNGAENAGRRVPTLTGDNYGKYQEFLSWLDANGYRTVSLHDQSYWFDHAAGRHPYDIFDVDRSGALEGTEGVSLDTNGDGHLSDDERDEDADGLSNYVELRGPMSGTGYWSSCYTAEPKFPVPYLGTDPANGDTDGDGVRDGADDQDHDDVPNLMELSRQKASHLDDNDNGVNGTVTGNPKKTCEADEDLDPDLPWHDTAFGKVQPFNPCDPDPTSRSCGGYHDFGYDPGPEWWSLQ